MEEGVEKSTGLRFSHSDLKKKKINKSFWVLRILKEWKCVYQGKRLALKESFGISPQHSKTLTKAANQITFWNCHFNVDISPDGMFRLALITPFCAKYGYEEFYTFLLQNWTIVLDLSAFGWAIPLITTSMRKRLYGSKASSSTVLFCNWPRERRYYYYTSITKYWFFNMALLFR